MKKTAIFFAALFAAFFFAYAKKQKAPEWAVSPHAVYSEEEWIAECGEGQSQDAARNHAMTKISHLFNVKFQSSQSLYTKISSEAESGGAALTKKSSETAAAYDVRSDAELLNVQYEFFFDEKKKNHYCLARINRKKTWDFLFPKMEAEKAAFRDFLKMAKSQTDVLLAIRYYALAFACAKELAKKRDYVSVIMPEKSFAYNEEFSDAQKIFSEMSRLKRSALIFLKVEGEDEDNRIFDAERGIFSAAGFVITENSQAPYIARSKVALNVKTDRNGFSARPSVSFEIARKNELLFSYSKALPKESYFSESLARSQAANSIAAELEKSLLEEFYKSL